MQVGLFLTLVVAGGLMRFGSEFTTGMIHDQLAAQKISFPEKGTPGFDPKTYPGLQRYAGQAVDNGPKAKAFADEYIASHLKKIAGGKTYAEVSAASRANPGDQKLVSQRQSLFEGETLRGMLLSAWGWSVIGSLTGFGAMVAFGGAVVVLAVLMRGVLRTRG